MVHSHLRNGRPWRCIPRTADRLARDPLRGSCPRWHATAAIPILLARNCGREESVMIGALCLSLDRCPGRGAAQCGHIGRSLDLALQVLDGDAVGGHDKAGRGRGHQSLAEHVCVEERHGEAEVLNGGGADKEERRGEENGELGLVGPGLHDCAHSRVRLCSADRSRAAHDRRRRRWRRQLAPSRTGSTE
jgi:hypothetical protein